METTWRAHDVRVAARLLIALLILMLVLATATGAILVGAQLLRTTGPDRVPPVMPAFAMPPTACPAGTELRSGDIATVAGTGVIGSSGDGGAALAAAMAPSYGMIAIGPDATTYLSDGAAIRRITSDGRITAVAGPTTHAPFVTPTGLAFSADGSLYIADLTTSRIWMLGADGSIISVVGTGTSGSSGNGGPATDALVQPAQVAVGPRGDLYFDDLNSYRTVDPSGTIQAFAGTGQAGYSGDAGPAIQAEFATNVLGVAADGRGNVYVGDPGNHRIRRVDPAGIVTTFAGTGLRGYSGDDGLAVQAQIDHPITIAVDDAGNVYFADQGNATVRKVDAGGLISTVAGSGHPGFSGDCGPATSAQLNAPYGLAVRDGVVIIGDESNHRIRMVVP